jgi:hypothetical protein
MHSIPTIHQVAQKFFRSVLSRETGLLRNSTVIFATNQLQWLPKVFYIDMLYIVAFVALGVCF